MLDSSLLVIEGGVNPIATHVFQTVKVLVPLPADITLERLLLLHTHRTWIGSTSLRVDD